MFKNYLKIAWRVFIRNKAFSSINLFGLALGMACSLLIFLWIKDEQHVDAFHKNKEQLYNVFEREFADNKVTADYDTPGLLAEEVKKTLPEVQYAVSADWDNDFTFRYGGKSIMQNGGFASEDFFKMFTYPLLEGNASNALNGTADIVISRKMAIAFFGNPAAAMGKTLERNSGDAWKEFTVTAVFDDLPAYASQKFDFIATWQVKLDEAPGVKAWYNAGTNTTLMLRPDASPELVQRKIKNFLDKYVDQTHGHRVEFGLARYDKKYLYGNFSNGEVSGGRIEYVKLFGIVAVFILLIACINFMNLSTARSVKRAKEIGVRKVIGALRVTLIKQFIGEAMLLSFFAAGIALLLVAVVLPLFNNITGKQMMLPVADEHFWLILIVLIITTGLFSGAYPALFLSSFNPIKVLKGRLKIGGNSLLFRKGLVVFQFTLSIVLIIGTIVISKQVNFIQTKNIGFDRENLIYIPLDGELASKYALFKEKAKQMPGIKDVTRMIQVPTTIDNGSVAVDWDGKASDYKPSFSHTSIGYDYVKTLHLQMLQGRDYSPKFPTDSVGYIINEAAAKKIGYKNPVGSRLTFWGRKGTIIGVIKDFHYASLHDPINPLILRFGENDSRGNLLIRTERGETRQALTSLEQLYKTLNPKFPFSYQFADEEYQKLYKSEEVVGRLSNAFAFLGIFISCLGLLGLAMFTAEQRTKEIGVRKVLGANTGQIFGLLSKEFLQLVFIAILIATPIAWYMMSNWLAGYSYRINISWWIFLVAGALAVSIALVTISFQALKAALANPVKSLRTE